MYCKVQFDTSKIKSKFGYDGRLQDVLDSEVIKYLRQTMPYQNGVMSANTRREKRGSIVVAVPYAHYQNEGVLYVMANGKGAYHDPISGRYWSEPGVKKVPSSRKLNYHGGADRGAHFVERTCKGHLEDIMNTLKKEVNK